jgi:predicted TIM-barrel fold metal-dependent hydrolase
MMIDIFPHIMTKKYKDELYKRAGQRFYLRDVTDATPALWDLEARFRIMDEYDGLAQVLTVASPPVEDVFDPEDAATLSKIANDDLAELVTKYPDRFVGAAACLPMNNMDAALKEVDRALRDLGLKGVQIYSPINDKPLDHPDFMPLYEKMAEYDLPIWIHPKRDMEFADYRTETRSKYWVFSMFGWPYETTAAMTRLVFSGVLERWPNIKFITHHCGGMVAFFSARIAGGQEYAEKRLKAKFKRALSKPPIEYFRMFYADTALYGAMPSLMCGYSFFGAEHLLFATDMPYDAEGGEVYTKETIDAVEQMPISVSERRKIFEDNARRILKL